MRRLALTFALTAVAFASPLSAQVRTTSFGLSGGLSLPMGDLADGAETGFNVTGSLYIRPARFANLGFRGDIAYDRFGLKAFEDSNIRSMGFVFNGQYNVPVSSSSVTPYVLLGIGFYSTKTTRAVGNTSISSSDSNLGYDGGAGISFQLSGFSTFLEAKYVHVMTEGENRGVNFAPITFGIRF
jgi:opacity protein-like surface antigen